MAVFKAGIWNPRADFFDFNLKFLFYVGLWPDETCSFRKKCLYKIYEFTLYMFAFIYITLTGIGTYLNREDVIVLFTNIDKTIVAYNYVFKIIIFFIQRNQIKILINEILHSGDKIGEVQKKIMVVHVVMISGMILTLTVIFQILAQMKEEMPVDAWLPFDPLKNQLSLLLASQILGILFLIPCVYRAISIQGIVCCIIIYLCYQLTELQTRLKALSYSVENQANMREEFKSIIKKHIRLMGYAKSLRQAFQEYFLIQNLAVTAELCLNALMVTIVGMDHKKQLLTFLAFLMVALFNAFIFCHLGNELMDQSAGIAMAAYEASWISWPLDMQRDLLVVVTVAQKSFVLTAGGMAYMSMQTFAQALYNGYSMFAVLRDVVN